MKICVIGTFDTKKKAYQALIQFIQSLNHSVVTINIGALPYSPLTEVETFELLDETQKQKYFLSLSDSKDRTQEAVNEIIQRGRKILPNLSLASFDAVVGLGGGNGTFMLTQLMETFPKKVRKICVSTLAPRFPHDEISMIPAITDIIEMNSILNAVIQYTAKFTCDEIDNLHDSDSPYQDSVSWATQTTLSFLSRITSQDVLKANAKKTVAITMFGNTTSCVEECLRYVTRQGYEVLVFHATGVGGEVMSQLINLDIIAGGIIDITTTELADLFFNGALAASKERFYTPGKKGLPHIIVPGCIDMINYPRGEVPKSRQINPQYDWGPFTLSRTTAEDNQLMAEFMADVANHAIGPIAVYLPNQFSKLDGPAKPLFLAGANETFINTMEKKLKSSILPVVIKAGINDKEFIDYLKIGIRNILNQHPKWLLSKNSPHLFVKNKDAARLVIMKKLHHKLTSGECIVGCGAGNGLNAKAAEAGGADLVVVYNSGYFRTQGLGSLAGMMPYANANNITFEIGKQVLREIKNIPVIAGLCATDPQNTLKELLIKTQTLGFSGVQNYPTVGLIDQGFYRQSLEETGMGYDQEVKMIALAHQMGLLTTPYVFTPEDAINMTKVGASIIVAHLGLTIGALSDSKAKSTKISLKEAPFVIQKMIDAARKTNPHIIVLAHGGPLNTPESFKYLKEHTKGLNGFYGASAIEREPVHTAIKSVVEEYKSPQKIVSKL